MRAFVSLLLLLLLPSAAIAIEQPEFKPQLGQQIDMTTPLTDSTGQTRALSDWTHGRPALVTFGYHLCPNLCGVVQQVVAQALQKTQLDGDDYVPLFITLTPDETADDAAGAKARLADAAGADAAAPWLFMSGDAVTGLADQFGIGVIERARIQQFVHPVAVFALTPDGRIARVLPGLDITAHDLRLAAVEASQGSVGNLIDQIVLFCAGYDPTKGQYSSVVEAGLRWGGALTVLLALAGIGWLHWLEKRA
jgi:protein SCO1/2